MEKVRYECRYNEKLMKHYIFDNENKEYLGYNGVVRVLNQQDARIKELEDKNGYIIFADEHDDNGIEVNKQVYTTYMSKCDELIELIQENQQLKQSQNQKAIEELEKVKRYFDDNDPNDKSDGWIITNRDVVNYVDNQIKELMGE